MKLFLVLVLLCVPITGVDDVRSRYIASLLKSGWTVQQLQENGIIEKPNITMVTTTDSSIGTVTILPTTENSTAVGSTLSATTTEIPITSTTLLSSSTTAPVLKKIISVPTSVNTSMISNVTVNSTVVAGNVTLNGRKRQLNKIVVPPLKSIVTQSPKILTTAVSTTAISHVGKIEKVFNKSGNFGNSGKSDNKTEVVLSPIVNSSDVVINSIATVNNVTHVSDNVTVDLLGMGYIQSGLSRLLRNILIDWEEQVTEKSNGSIVLLPDTSTWEPVDPVKAAEEDEGVPVHRGSPDSVTLVDLPLRGPLSLLLLALVALIAGKSNTFTELQASLMSILSRVRLCVFYLLTCYIALFCTPPHA